MVLNSYQKKQLNQQILNTQQSRMRFSSNVRSTMTPSFARAMTGNNGPSARVSPLRNMAQQVDLPEGTPITDLHLPLGLGVEQDVTITIDTTALGNTATVVNTVIFDEGEFHKARTNYTNTAIVSIDGNVALYRAWLGGLCGGTFYLDNVLMNVTPAAAAAATAQQQFQKNITRYEYTARDGRDTIIPISNYVDPYAQNQNVRPINLNGTNARFDRATAWVLPTYHGMVITLTFNVLAYKSGK